MGILNRPVGDGSSLTVAENAKFNPNFLPRPDEPIGQNGTQADVNRKDPQRPDREPPPSQRYASSKTPYWLPAML